jgi:D-alanyl-D-alanine carboxypeptidase (penicillin-binding protein 5/6)
MRKLLVLFLCISSLILEAQQLKVDVSAKAAILINAKTGAILYEKESHQPCYPASTTKIATALYALEKKRDALDEWVTATQDQVGVMNAHTRQAHIANYPPYRLEHDGTMMGLLPGETHLLRTLFYGMMLVSGNDATNAIACHVSGSIPKFVAELNAFLRERGIHETTFHNPHGLYYPGHLTTAHDMAKITQLALKDPIFREIVKTVRYTRPESNKKPESVMVQFNRLLKPGKFYYPRAIGVKTGYVAKAGFCLSAAAVHEDRELIAVLLGCPISHGRFEDATALFNAAFAEAKVTRKLFAKECDVFSCVIKGAKSPLCACLSEDVSIDYYPSEEPELKAFLEWHKISLPIVKGQSVGEVRLIEKEGGQLLSCFPIYATTAVQKTPWLIFKEFCSKFGITILLLLLSSAGTIAWFLKKKPKPVA